LLLANSCTMSSVISFGNLFLNVEKSITGTSCIGSTFSAAVTSVASIFSSPVGVTILSSTTLISVSPVSGVPIALLTQKRAASNAAQSE